MSTSVLVKCATDAKLVAQSKSIKSKLLNFSLEMLEFNFVLFNGRIPASEMIRMTLG